MTVLGASDFNYILVGISGVESGTFALMHGVFNEKNRHEAAAFPFWFNLCINILPDAGYAPWVNLRVTEFVNYIFCNPQNTCPILVCVLYVFKSRSV